MKQVLYLPIVLAVLTGLCACDRDPGNILEVTGQIEGNGANVGSRIGGRVLEVVAREGARVNAGDALVRLDDADAQATLRAAEADIARAAALVKKLETGATAEEVRQAEAAVRAAEERWRMLEKGARSEEIRGAEAAVEGARSQMSNAQTEYKRLSKLFEDDVVSQNDFDRASTALRLAESQYQQVREKLDMLSNGARVEEIAMAKADFDRAQAVLDEIKRGPREEDIASAKAALQAATAARDRAQVALDEMVVKAPSTGVVESLDLRPGDIVKPGAIARVVDPEDLEVMVYVGAAILGRLKIGQKIALTTDAHGTARFDSEISYIAPEGEYTPRNLQTREERVQQVFGVKLRLNGNGGKLRPGMTVTAHLPTAGAEG